MVRETCYYCLRPHPIIHHIKHYGHDILVCDNCLTAIANSLYINAFNGKDTDIIEGTKWLSLARRYARMVRLPANKAKLHEGLKILADMSAQKWHYRALKQLKFVFDRRTIKRR